MIVQKARIRSGRLCSWTKRYCVFAALAPETRRYLGCFKRLSFAQPGPSFSSQKKTNSLTLLGLPRHKPGPRS